MPVDFSPQHNGGLAAAPPRPKDWLGGAATGLDDSVALESGDWRPYMSDPHEMQIRGFNDFMGCTKFAATDAIEAYMKMRFDVDANNSDRALYALSGQGSGGDSLWNTLETVRQFGLAPEEACPWTADAVTVDKYRNLPPTMRAEAIAEGKKWLEKWRFGYEFLYDDFGVGLEWGLRRSPLLACGLYASESLRDRNGVYHPFVPNAEKAEHAFALLMIDSGDRTKYIDDSYSVQLKRLSPDFRIPSACRIWVDRVKPITPNMKYPPKNSLVVVADTGERLMYVDGEHVYSDAAGKIVMEVTARNAADGVTRPFPVFHCFAADIAHLKRVPLNWTGKDGE